MTFTGLAVTQTLHFKCDVYRDAMKRKSRKIVDDPPQQSMELKKHVAVIHSGSNKLTLLQRKIANALLFNAYKELLTSDEHVINISSLCNMIGYSSNDHKTIKNSLVNLLSTVLQWNLVDGNRVELEDEGVWNASSIIADASIDGPICTYSYSNKMKKLLYRPNVYGRLDLLVQAKFQSGYGLALYENCNRFQDVGRTPWIEIEKFRLLMGVKEQQYKIFRDFKNRVINKAIEEVNKYSPITIDPRYRKQGRKVISIQFMIVKDAGNLTSISSDLSKHSNIKDALKERFCLTEKQITQVCSEYDPEYIKGKMIFLEKSNSYKNKKIINLGRYLMAALEDDYQDKKGTECATSTSSVKTFNEEYEKKQNQQKEIEYRRYQDREIHQRFEQLNPIKKEGLLTKFEKYLVVNGRGLYLDIYEREGIRSGLIKDHLSIFLRKALPEILEDIMSFDDWCSSEGG